MNDTSMHRHTWDQIPWMVNGTLPPAERDALQAHLTGCADCRAELEFQRRLAASLEAGSVCEIDSQESWKQLRARIEAVGRSEVTRHGQRRSRGSLAGEWIPWLVAAMVVQAIGLGALGTVIWSKPGASVTSGSTYRTLSGPEPPVGGATLRVVFAPDMSVGNMQALLSAAGLQVQSGPSSAGVWSLEPARDSNRSATQSALRELRDSPAV
ncbi:MAG TPA: zf-HC2 domain-containing protein, partial [Steroidobacteraceae bacterium]|nr:zf-HC2 domain-containing protein [Steroidobacteraceae bacterium]